MFEDSLVESTHRIRTQNRWIFAASVGAQALAAALVITIPLLHPETLQKLALMPPALIAPLPVPPPPPRVAVTAARASGGPSAPSIPQMVMATGHSLVDRLLPPVQAAELPPRTLTGNLMGSDPAVIGMGVGTSAGRPSVVIAKPAKPLAISSGVSAGLLLEPIRPVYPALAKAAHMEGTVVIHAIISRTGTIESAAVISGPAMLQGAAIDAVRVARYRPFRLNGEPTEVETTIQINFRLSS